MVTMKQNWIQECAECVLVGAYLPLWKADRELCFAKLLTKNFMLSSLSFPSFVRLSS